MRSHRSERDATLHLPTAEPLTWRKPTATKRRMQLRTAASRRGKKARWPRARTWPPPPCCWSGWRPCCGWAAPSSKCWPATPPSNWAAMPGSRPTRSSSSPTGSAWPTRWPAACCRSSGCSMFTGIAANFLQVGFLFLPEKLAPDLTRLDPLQGFARLFSLASLVRLVMGLLKMALVAGVAYASLYGQREKVLGLAAMTTPEIAALSRADPDLDEHEDRPGLAAAGGLGLRLSMVEAGARPADDDAGGPRGTEEPGGQSADGRAAEAGPAATGPASHFHRGAQGRRRDHQPHRIGHRHPVRSRRRWPRRSWWPRGPA